MQVDSEQLEFVVVLSGTWWRQPPKFAIYIDDKLMVEDVTRALPSGIGTENESTMTPLDRANSRQEIRFTADLEPGEHRLSVRLMEKTHSDTMFINGQRIKDMLLNIEAVRIDDVDIENLVFSDSYYDTDREVMYDGQRTQQIRGCTSLGYVGTWHLPFTSPFYLWLLERL